MKSSYKVGIMFQKTTQYFSHYDIEDSDPTQNENMAFYQRAAARIPCVTTTLYKYDKYTSLPR